MGLLRRARKQGRRYQNPVPTTLGGLSLMWKVAPLYFKDRQQREPKNPLGPFRTDPQRYATPPESGLRVTWFGHSSTLLEIDGLRVLIDPVWEQRASPFRWTGPRRFFAPTLRLEEMPELDAVLISHDHYDHLGATTVGRLAELDCTQRALWVTSDRVGQRLHRLGVPDSRVVELDWTQSVEVPGAEDAGDDARSLTIAAWPARHFSGRWLHDRNSTLWSSFVIEGPQHRVFYGADSGWWEGFAAIAANYHGFDLTMLEIGAYHPLWGDIHLGPDGAARAYKAMGGADKAGALMPIHWGMFNLALHGWREPIEQLDKAATRDGMRLFAPEPGLPTEVNPGQVVRSSWWNGAKP